MVINIVLIVATVIVVSSGSGISKGALAGIILGAIACAVTLSAIVTILILRVRLRDYRVLSRRRSGGEYLIMNKLAYYYFSIRLVFSALPLPQ